MAGRGTQIQHRTCALIGESNRAAATPIEAQPVRCVAIAETL
jgi:hypothetical protein